MIRLGITGGIGSGKSYVSHLLAETGIPVYDTDSNAKRLMMEHPSIQKQLVELLGTNVYVEGRLNKPLLAEYLFSSSENASRINSIVHPIVKQDFQEWALRHSGTEVVVMECAILYESGFDKSVDKILMVYAPEEIRLQRAMQRDGATEIQIRSRMAAQFSEEEKRKRADFVIINDGVCPLWPQLQEMIDKLTTEKGR